MCKCHLAVVLIHIFLMTDDHQHIFLILVTIYVSSLEKISIEFFSLLLTEMSFSRFGRVYISLILKLYQTSDFQVISTNL